MIIKDIPKFERPREKVINQGVQYLSNNELIAILLRTGTKNQNVLKVSEQILYKLSNINDLAYIKQLTTYKNYIESKTDKVVNLYLYSIMKSTYEKVG